MSKYIDAVKAAEIVSERQKIPLSELVDTFAEVPTADVKEVKHGQWIKDRNFNDDLVRCSACRILSDRQPNYYPYCGARMDGGNEE